MNTIAIVQARIGSARLPSKVLLDIIGQPMLQHVLERVSRSEKIDLIVVATTDLPEDEAIVSFCNERGWNCFRGSSEDVLDRYYRTALKYEAGIIVRITSDCPLIEPSVIDRTVSEFLSIYPDIDYSSNNRISSFPRGLDTEVMTFEALERCWKENDNPRWREHVTMYKYNHLDNFRIHDTLSEIDYSDLRWTVDTPQDLELVRKIYDHFSNNSFTWTEVMNLLEKNPSWIEINKDIVQKREEGRIKRSR